MSESTPGCRRLNVAWDGRLAVKRAVPETILPDFMEKRTFSVTVRLSEGSTLRAHTRRYSSNFEPAAGYGVGAPAAVRETQ
ncbi:hypothetical protein [Microcoleus sp. FACHB-68]|uniref:hypothetical protein n=1 Tax=Microcoleus sp. FACHB-68 TaxID=2692826 RepID=UPI0016839CC8|nr:hypothetical protein [Microcoleus sp. FACHB-68]MBD1940019.1 hypothetical protein [Microcoleus sp. FACHB-68]